MRQIKVTAPKAFVPCTIQLPISKSIANRVLAISALACKAQEENADKTAAPEKSDRWDMEGEVCDDIRAMRRVVDSIRGGEKGERVIDVGAAGTAMRFATAILAVKEGDWILTGSRRLKERPIKPLVDALREMGADIEYLGEQALPPLRIRGKGKMKGGRITIPGNISSQFISALMMIAPLMQEGMHISITGEIMSRPYIDMTMEVMNSFVTGKVAEWTKEREINIRHGQYCYSYRDIEPDWTAASYWYEIFSIMDFPDGEKYLPGRKGKSIQGDGICRELFDMINNDGERGRLGFSYDFSGCPDLVQTMVATCCMKGIQFRFTGVSTLRIKETNRLEALRVEMAKMGYMLETGDDCISWEPTPHHPTPATGAGAVVIDTYSDHRMAMALAPCSLKVGEIIVNDPDVVSKSYPTFWDDLRKTGFRITEIS